MNPQPTDPLTVPRLSQALLAVVIGCSVLVLAGWAADSESLKRVIGRSVAMNPSTALCFLSLGAVLLLSLKGPNPRVRVFFRLAMAMTVLISASRLAGYAFGFDSLFDRLLFASKLAATESEPPNRMAPATALNFVLAVTALCCLGASGGKRLIISQSAVLIMLLTSFISFIGYTVGAQKLYQPLPFIGMAIHTSFCFLLLGMAILAANPNGGVASVILSRRLGGGMARKILPAAIFAPVVIGWFVHWGQRARVYGDELGVGLMILTCVLLLAPVTLRAAAQLNHAEEERIQREAEARQTYQHLIHALDISGSAIVSINADQEIVFFDDRAERMFGWSKAEALNRPIDTILPERFRASHRLHVEKFARSGERARRMGERSEVFGLRRDGSEFPAEAAISRSEQSGAPIFTAVVHDITERKRAQEEVLRRERLAAANEELESFSYSVSHDLRAPLRHVDGFIQLLEKRAAGSLDEKSRHYLTTISESATRMGRLIDDLLSFSRMARTELNRQPTPLGEVVNEVLSELSPETEGRRIEWKVDPLPTVDCDRQMLKLVFQNLLGNAVKFTRHREEARIEVGVENGGGADLTFLVRDNGAGFDMGYKEKLFGVFQRLHSQDEFEGTGIGLANVRRIVRRHGGEAWAEGEVGKGASFHFTLPAGSQEEKRI